MLTSLSSLQMQKIAANDAKDLGKYGLDKPDGDHHGERRQHSRIAGDRQERGRIRLRARRVAADGLHDSGDDGGGSPEGRDTLRRKDMFDGRSFNATRVELKRGGETLTFEQVEGQGRQGRLEERGGQGWSTPRRSRTC